MQNFFQKPFFILLLSVGLYFVFGTITITKYHTADEHFWLPNYGTNERIQNYWKALLSGDWKDTRVNDKPGISTALISGIALPFAQNAINNQILFDDGVVKIYNPEATEQINFLFRFPLLLFNGLFLFYFFWILKKITRDEWVSLWACIGIILSPVILGISQIVNPDTLFWSFGSATLFTFFAYLQKRKSLFFWIAAPLFGFTLLSKYVGVIFLPFFFAMIAADYLFRFSSFHGKTSSFAQTIKKDLIAYAATLFGGVILFALLMPAAIANPKILYESTIGFPGMLPIFLSTLLFGLSLLFDAILFESRLTKKILSALTPKKIVFEKILYGILFFTLLFTLLNWMSRNSLTDLSGIAFDEKTKTSFTTDNPYPARFVAEWVPLTFALTPITVFLLLFTWMQGLFGILRHRTFVFILSLFFLIFYVAVIEQGLLVTVRYSIILFPLAILLSAISARSLFFPKTTSEERFTRFSIPLFIIFFAGFFTLMTFHSVLPKGGKITLENILGNFFWIIAAATVCVAWGIAFFTEKSLAKKTFPKFSPFLISLLFLAAGSTSLFLARPHYFAYTNTLLPKRYLLFHSWGYGGYEAAQYLNSKPNAQNLTLWADSYGVCEFFVGKCIKKQKVDINAYPIDYIYRTLRGTVAPKFPYTVGSPEWEYAVGGRNKNFVRLYKNEYPQ